MRPILVKLGPWEPWQIVFVFATLLAITLLWRRIEARLEDTDELRPIRWPATLGGCILGAVGLYLLVNRFAPVEIKSYGVMLLVAFTAGLWWLGRNAPAQLELADIIDLGLTLLISAVVGARILYVVIEWGAPDGYAANPRTVLNVWEGGLSFHGGVLGALVGGLIYSRVKKVPLLLLADLAAAPLALGYAFARVGCFLNGCCQGVATTLPWGVCFPADTPPGQACVAVHPTQIYASLASLGIFAILVRLREGYPRQGYLFGAYLVIYSFARFLLEYTRRGVTGEVVTAATPDPFHHALALALLLLTTFFAVAVLLLPRLASPEKVLRPPRRLAVALAGLAVLVVAVAMGALLGDSPAIAWASPLTMAQVASAAIGGVMFAVMLGAWPAKVREAEKPKRRGRSKGK